MRSATLTVTWEVEDGYMGGSRPHSTEIDIEDMIWMDEESRDQFIEDCVQEDFDQKIAWFIKDRAWPDDKEPDWESLQEDED